MSTGELNTLIAKAQGEDLAAFEEIVRRFQDMACGCAYSIIGDFHLAEDAAQEAFIDAYRHLRDLREPAAFPGWFRRIVMKHCNRITRRKQVKVDSLDVAGNAAASGDEPASTAERHEMQERVMAAVRALPEHQRMVTSLFYINGYSQRDIADFLEVPVTTVKKRLHDSRKRLKERMIDMVSETLKHNAPDERFSQKVIAELLGRPRLLDIEGHPVRQVWELIRTALPDYEVISGDEIEDKTLFAAVRENMDRAYHVNEQKALRTQMSITTLKAIKGRKPPVRLLAPGRVFRPCKEDSTHLRLFHQLDGICIEEGADLATLKVVCQRTLESALGSTEVVWHEADFGFVSPGLLGGLNMGDNLLDVIGCGMLSSETLQNAGYDPETVTGFAFGLGLERLAMIKFGIDDIRKLWQPPYAPTCED